MAERKNVGSDVELILPLRSCQVELFFNNTNFHLKSFTSSSQYPQRTIVGVQTFRKASNTQSCMPRRGRPEAISQRYRPTARLRQLLKISYDLDSSNHDA